MKEQDFLKSLGVTVGVPSLIQEENSTDKATAQLIEKGGFDFSRDGTDSFRSRLDESLDEPIVKAKCCKDVIDSGEILKQKDQHMPGKVMIKRNHEGKPTGKVGKSVADCLDDLCKAGHKYIKREGSSGHYSYTYAPGAMGYTRSGKAVHSDHAHPSHVGFSDADHADASGLHGKMASLKGRDREASGKHRGESLKHLQSMNSKPANQDNYHKERGKGIKHAWGQAGVTRSGKLVSKEGSDTKHWTNEDHSDAHQIHSDMADYHARQSEAELEAHRGASVYDEENHHGQWAHKHGLDSEGHKKEAARHEASSKSKILGHTKSGKPIHEHADSPEHAGFGVREHKEAMKLHYDHARSHRYAQTSDSAPQIPQEYNKYIKDHRAGEDRHNDQAHAHLHKMNEKRDVKRLKPDAKNPKKDLVDQFKDAGKLQIHTVKSFGDEGLKNTHGEQFHKDNDKEVEKEVSKIEVCEHCGHEMKKSDETYVIEKAHGDAPMLKPGAKAHKVADPEAARLEREAKKKAGMMLKQRHFKRSEEITDDELFAKALGVEKSLGDNINDAIKRRLANGPKLSEKKNNTRSVKETLEEIEDHKPQAAMTQKSQLGDSITQALQRRSGQKAVENKKPPVKTAIEDDEMKKKPIQVSMKSDFLTDLAKACSEKKPMNPVNQIDLVKKKKVRKGFVLASGPGGLVMDFGLYSGNQIADNATRLLNNYADPVQAGVVTYQQDMLGKALENYVAKGEANYEVPEVEMPKKPEIPRVEVNVGGEIVKAMSETDAAVLAMMKQDNADTSITVDVTGVSRGVEVDLTTAVTTDAK